MISKWLAKEISKSMASHTQEKEPLALILDSDADIPASSLYTNIQNSPSHLNIPQEYGRCAPKARRAHELPWKEECLTDEGCELHLQQV